MTWWGRIALVVGTLAAAVVGWQLTSSAGGDDAATAVGAVDLVSCPTSDGAVTIGRLSDGDQVWLIGRTGEQWAVIRHPDDSLRPAWVPLARVDTAASTRDLPELRCDQAEVVVATTTSMATATTTAATSTTTTLPPSTSSSSTLPPTTVSTDRTPPTVVVTPERSFLYVATPIAPCNAESSLLVAITVSDPTLPLSIRSIVATWDGPAGPQTAFLTPAGGNRFQLVVDEPGTVAGEAALTLTATANDGAGNVGTGVAVVSLRDPASFGCSA